MRRLGIDFGARRIGLALADDGTTLAYPHRTVECGSAQQGVADVAAEVRALSIDEIIVGLPLKLDGSVGESARRATQFADRLRELVKPPVVMWDERLSTRHADAQLRESGLRGRAKRRVIDQAAATVILQSYIDAQENAWRDG